MGEKTGLALAATNTELGGLRERYRSVAVALGNEAGWADWLGVARRFADHSYANQLLIAAQAPGARLLLTAAQWKVHGRTVDPDASPVWLTGPGRRTGAQALRSHYDIVQTIGRPVFVFTDPPAPNAREERAFALWQALTGIAKAHGADVACAGSDAGTSLARGQITVPAGGDHERNSHLAGAIVGLLLREPTPAQRAAVAATVAVEAGVPGPDRLPAGGPDQAQALHPALSAIVTAVREAGVAVPAPALPVQPLLRPRVAAIPPPPAAARGVAL